MIYSDDSAGLTLIGDTNSNQWIAYNDAVSKTAARER